MSKDVYLRKLLSWKVSAADSASKHQKNLQQHPHKKTYLFIWLIWLFWKNIPFHLTHLTFLKKHTFSSDSSDSVGTMIKKLTKSQVWSSDCPLQRSPPLSFLSPFHIYMTIGWHEGYFIVPVIRSEILRESWYSQVLSTWIETLEMVVWVKVRQFVLPKKIKYIIIKDDFHLIPLY